jgi:hypothetical protein
MAPGAMGRGVLHKAIENNFHKRFQMMGYWPAAKQHFVAGSQDRQRERA